MFKIYHNCSFGSSGVNWISYIAVFISIFTICCSAYFVYLTKRVEIINVKFQKFCISHFEIFFSQLDSKMKNNNAKVKKVKKEITDIFTEVQLYITILKNIYPAIDVKALIMEIEKFTDMVYEDDDKTLIEIKSEYSTLKLKLYSQLYDFALKRELSLFYRIGLKK